MAPGAALLQPVRSAPEGRYDEDEEDVLDDKIRQMLRDLGRALSDAISESADVTQALHRIHEEGYSLFIFLDRRSAGDGDEELAGARRDLPARPHGEPVFRIHGGDLSFLRSIGIDPTRRVRSRKPR
jgi:hypothetical protein